MSTNSTLNNVGGATTCNAGGATTCNVGGATTCNESYVFHVGGVIFVAFVSEVLFGLKNGSD